VPGGGDDDGVDRHVAVDDPVEAEVGPSEVAHELLDTETGIEQPAPHRPGDDERHGERIEEDRAQEVFAADALIEQHRQNEAGERRQADEAHAIEHEIDVGDLDVLGAHHRPVAAQPGPTVLGQ
jgi:hypothetical protein